MLDLTQPADRLAPLLLGALVRDHGVTLRLSEVEAYDGTGDPAAHAWRGPRPHTRDLFAPPGTLYCYRSHGLHICGNITCGDSGAGAAILFRAAAVVDGVDLARQRRGPVPDVALARGPGNLGRAIGWTLADSGRRFGGDGLALVDPTDAGPPAVRSGPRVGVSVAHTRAWRFWIEADPTVSAYRRSPRIQPGRYDW